MRAVGRLPPTRWRPAAPRRKPLALRALEQLVEHRSARQRTPQGEHVIRELLARERPRRDSGDPRIAAQLRQVRTRRMRAVQIVGPIGQHQQQPLGARAAHDEAQQIARRTVGPVQVLDHHDRGPLRAQAPRKPQQQLEQPRPPKRVRRPRAGRPARPSPRPEPALPTRGPSGRRPRRARPAKAASATTAARPSPARTESRARRARRPARRGRTPRSPAARRRTPRPARLLPTPASPAISTAPHPPRRRLPNAVGRAAIFVCSGRCGVLTGRPTSNRLARCQFPLERTALGEPDRGRPLAKRR